MAKRNIKFLLPNRKNRIRLNAEYQMTVVLPSDIAAEKELRELEREARSQWVNQNTLFSSEEYLKVWSTASEKAKQTFSNIVIKYLAIGDGAVEANSMLKHGLRMQEAEIEVEEISDFINRLIRIDIVHSILGDTQLPPEVCNTILQRMASIEFPLQDNMPKAKPVAAVKEMLAKYISRGDYSGKKDT